MLGFGSVDGEYMELLVPTVAVTLAGARSALVQLKYEVLLVASTTAHFVPVHLVVLLLPLLLAV